MFHKAPNGPGGARTATPVPPDARPSHTNAEPACSRRSGVLGPDRKANQRLGVQARGRGSSAVGPARAGRGYSVTAAPRGHRLPLLPVTNASASARSALGGRPAVLRPLREETAQDQGPRNYIGCARPRQAPPPEPPLPLSPGGVCAAAGIGSDAATLSCLWCSSPTGVPGSRSRWAQLGRSIPKLRESGAAALGTAPPLCGPVHGRVWDLGPRGAALRPPRSLPHAAQKQRTGGRAVELGTARSWALGPMPVRPRGPAPWPLGAWPSAYSRRPPAPCACSTLPSP